MKKSSPHRHGVTYRMVSHGAVALIRRPPRGLLGGMLALPTTEWREQPFTTREALAAAPAAARWVERDGVEHVFTHFSLELRVFEARVETADPAWTWTPLAEAPGVVPSVFAKALR